MLFMTNVGYGFFAFVCLSLSVLSVPSVVRFVVSLAGEGYQ